MPLLKEPCRGKIGLFLVKINVHTFTGTVDEQCRLEHASGGDKSRLMLLSFESSRATKCLRTISLLHNNFCCRRSGHTAIGTF